MSDVLIISDESNDAETDPPDIKNEMVFSDESNDVVMIPTDIKKEIVLSDGSYDDVKDVLDIEGLKRKRELEIEFKRLLQEKKLETKRLADEESLKKRKEKALKGMKYLLGLSEKYSSFFKEKVFSESKQPKAKPLQERNKFQPTIGDMKEAVKIKDKKTEENKYADVSKYLKYFEGGSLHPYQLDGVTWMTVLYENGINGILADEMGLGKTIQIIALFCHLLERGVTGPYLIVAPLSTLPNWKSEFQRFAPKLPVVVFHGSHLERRSMYKQLKYKYSLGEITTRPIVVTSYSVPLIENRHLQQYEWQYIVVDEGHRLKDHNGKLTKILRSFDSSNRLLLTGTPLQNNITELWALLNFLLPQIFNNEDTFASLLMVEDIQDGKKILEAEEKNSLISTIHKVLAPFMLRRLKKDVLIDMVPKKEINVLCPLSRLQTDLYSYVISKNIAKLLGKNEDEDDLADLDQPRKKRKCNLPVPKAELNDCPFIARITMQNVMMMFRKIVDHPFLIHFPLDPSSQKRKLLIDERLITSSGKMMVLDALLPRLKNNGHKVLIFSTLVMTLDLIEEFMILRGYTYRRLDGQMDLKERATSILDFNTNSDILAFLVSTRAGGLGLNLTGADTVIFFDRDWNPQVDIQAQDRSHRIGQNKPVVVYTLVTKNTIDERIILCGHQKRLLEKIVIKEGKFKTVNRTDRVAAANELKDLQDLLHKESHSANDCIFSTRELDKLIDRSELYEEMARSRK